MLLTFCGIGMKPFRTSLRSFVALRYATVVGITSAFEAGRILRCPSQRSRSYITRLKPRPPTIYRSEELLVTYCVSAPLLTCTLKCGCYQQAFSKR